MTTDFRRLAAQFEKHAQRFPDVSLSVYYVIEGEKPGLFQLSRPNHAIVLRQYLTPPASFLERLREDGLVRTNYGVGPASVSAFAVFEGHERSIELFRKLAALAGSVVPADVAAALALSVVHQVVPGVEVAGPVIASNSDPLAVWLTVMLSCVTTFQPERFRGRTLTVDPFTASLAVLDRLLESNEGGPQANDGAGERRFRVALAFPGEQRPYAQAVATELERRIGGVFCPGSLDDELAQRVYRYEAELVAVFLCADHERLDWCGLDWRVIRQLVRCRRPGAVMYLRLDDADIRGVASLEGYVDLRGKPPEVCAGLIERRLR